HESIPPKPQQEGHQKGQREEYVIVESTVIQAGTVEVTGTEVDDIVQ
ncbi:hypothetical protein A2U01_0071256, partial [Trifolium medium]|nr:hypothetical protein [Trifolium medium]